MTLPDTALGDEVKPFCAISLNSLLGLSLSHFDRIKVLEVDSYGRTLFLYDADSILYDCDLYAYMVCQKVDDNYAYYYEDFCFSLFDYFNNISDADFTKLKEINDWDKPLDESKMIKCKIEHTTFYEPQFHDVIIKAVKEKLKYGDGVLISCYPAYLDDNSKKLFLISIIQNVSDKKYIKDYIAIFNDDYSYNADTFIEELEDKYSYQNQLHSLKNKNGWSK